MAALKQSSAGWALGSENALAKAEDFMKVIIARRFGDWEEAAKDVDREVLELREIEVVWEIGSNHHCFEQRSADLAVQPEAEQLQDVLGAVFCTGPKT
jgi:hypothetical protein